MMNRYVSVMESPSWNKTASTWIHQRHIVLDPEDKIFSEIDNDDEREQRALAQAPGTFYVILTPRAFSRPSDCRDLTVKWYGHIRNSSQETAHCVLTADHNVVFLAKFLEPSISLIHAHRGRLNGYRKDSAVALLHPDVPGEWGADTQACVLHFKNHIHCKIVPLGSKIALDEDDGAEAIIRESQTFRPVRSPKIYSSLTC
ncbi:hypothetical protein QM012_002526 [Aureobasidium pullulans]|uniref:HNH nuclease domain-containing protein n=1 Tax=Aureobasidium pullulans TaxID=5580 RepID=A0ABR0TDC5_AURPU